MHELRHHAPWGGVFAAAAAIGLCVPLTMLFADTCSYRTCRDPLVPLSFAVGVTLVGVACTLIVSATMIHCAGRQGRPRFKYAVIALAGVLVSVCSGGALMAVDVDSRPDLSLASRDIEAMLSHIPGTRSVSIEIGNNFSAVVVLSEDASTEQANAIIAAFHHRTTALPDLREWDTDIEIRRNDQKSGFKVGNGGFATAADHIAQWHSLSSAFPDDEIEWTYRWSARSNSDTLSSGHLGVGDILLRLPHANDFHAVSETYRRLMNQFADLSSAKWQIETTAPERGYLQMNHRYPTEVELSVWDRLNIDQNPPHSVRMASQSVLPSSPTTWRPSVIERFDSQDLNAAKLLAEKHLPIVAELGASALDYLATPNTLDSLGSYDRDRGLRVTIGGCQSTDYPPTPTEQLFVDLFGQC